MATRTDRGFTLLELLVVVSIVGILASIAIPQYASYRARAFDSIVEAQVRHVATGQEAHFASHAQYTTDVADLEGMVVEDDVAIVITAGNSGDIVSSFKIHGSHAQASHEYDWVSDPLPGEPNFIISD
jgi:prepilin-type N-terminal cleavage/methylation domain-containing protein